MKPKRTNSAELAKRIIDLPEINSFTVSTRTERGVATTIARALRQAGRIDYQVASRKTEDGAFVFFIVPSAQ